MAKHRVVDVDSDEFEEHEKDLKHAELLNQLSQVVKILSETKDGVKSINNEKIIANIDLGITRLEKAIKANASDEAANRILGAINSAINRLHDRMSVKRNWNFIITRDSKGLIKSISAKEI